MLGTQKPPPTASLKKPWAAISPLRPIVNRALFALCGRENCYIMHHKEVRWRTVGNHQSYVYRYAPVCPNCGEEHCAYDFLLSEEEQAKLGQYYWEHRGETSVALLIADAPLVIERTFTCPMCKCTYTTRIGVYREYRLGYQSKDTIPMWRYSVFDDPL